MPHPGLSLSMIVKNEAKNLGRCLSSVINIVDEIIIVDTGSTDNTIEIAKEYGAKVFYYQWNNSFSDARNFALSQSNYNFILYLDADEYLEKTSITEISEITKKDNPGGYLCNVKSPMVNGSIVEMSYPRLFSNKPVIRFEGKVHEQIETSLINNGYKIYPSGISIVHTGYAKDDTILKNKAYRNLELLEKEAQENGTGYIFYQIANTYAVLNERQKAKEYYLKAYNTSELPDEYKIISLIYITEELIKRNDTENAVKLLLILTEYSELNKSDLITLLELSSKINNDILFSLFESKLINSYKSVNTAKKNIGIIYSDNDIIVRYLSLKCEIEKIDNWHLLIKSTDPVINDFIIINDLEKLINTDDLNIISDYLSDTPKSLLPGIMLLFRNFHPLYGDIVEKTLTSDIDNPELLLLKAQYYSETGKYHLSTELYKKLVNMPGYDNPAVMFYLCNELYKSGSEDELVKYVNLAFNKYQDNPIITEKIKKLSELIKK